MHTEHEPGWRGALTRRLLRIPDGALLLLTALWVVIATFTVTFALGNPATWWKSAIASIIVGGPMMYAMRLSQQRRNPDPDQRGSLADDDEAPSIPPGPGR